MPPDLPGADAPAPSAIPARAPAAPVAVSEAVLPPAATDGGAAPAADVSPASAAEPAAEPSGALADDGTAAAHAPGLLSVSEPEAKAGPAGPVAKPAAGSPDAPKLIEPEPAAAPDPLSYAEHKLTLPEGVTFDDARLGEYDTILGQHRIPPEARQQLADLYAGDVQQMLEKVRRDQYADWEKTRGTWREDCASDPDFGGSRFETNKASAIRMIEFFVPPEERRDFNLFLASTGAADHPQFFRLLNRLAQRFDEPAASPNNIQPAPPQRQGQGMPRRVRNAYTHPRSRGA